MYIFTYTPQKQPYISSAEKEAYNCSILRTLSTESNIIMLFIRVKYTVKMGLLVSNVLWQEGLGNRELYISNFATKHERKRHQESHQLPHEEEPEFAGTQTEGNVATALVDHTAVCCETSGKEFSTLTAF